MTEVEQGLSRAEDSSEPHTKSISDCTRRIAFLGTPHQGSEKAKWAELGRTFLSLFSEKSTGKTLKELEEGSATLVQLEVGFRKWLSHHSGESKTKAEIMCFFEELTSNVGTKSIGKVR